MSSSGREEGEERRRTEGGKEEQKGREGGQREWNVVFVADLFTVITFWQTRFRLQRQTEQRRLHWHWIPELDRYISSRR